MKKIVPFKKELFFKENIEEITSISLEHSLHQGEGNLITGEFFINGEYKVTNQTEVVDKFEFNLPVEIAVDDKYILSNSVIDIDDFYYEIFDSNVLLINIEVLLDKLEEKEIIKESDSREIFDDLLEEPIFIEDEDLFEEPVIIKDEIKEEEKEIMQQPPKVEFEEENEYNTYKIYIVNEGDNIDYIINNYGTTRELLEQYNQIDIINVGDKIIIPTND